MSIERWAILCLLLQSCVVATEQAEQEQTEAPDVSCIHLAPSLEVPEVVECLQDKPRGHVRYCEWGELDPPEFGCDELDASVSAVVAWCCEGPE